MKLPEMPDDDSDFTPDLARKIMELYRARNAKLVAALAAMTRDRDTWKGLADSALEAVRDFNQSLQG